MLPFVLDDSSSIVYKDEMRDERTFWDSSHLWYPDIVPFIVCICEYQELHEYKTNIAFCLHVW